MISKKLMGAEFSHTYYQLRFWNAAPTIIL